MTPLARKISRLLSPLDDCYESSGDALPDVEAVAGSAMPEPYRQLLVHDRDMTSTLEAFCGRRLHLRVLQKNLSGQTLLREVVLESDGAPESWEFGAIRIHLGPFDDIARQRILECRRPLGAILGELKIDYRCQPTDYFRIACDRISCEAFGLGGPHEPPRLYGRHTIISSPAGEPLAEVVEILPPLEDRR